MRSKKRAQLPVFKDAQSITFVAPICDFGQDNFEQLLLSNN